MRRNSRPMARSRLCPISSQLTVIAVGTRVSSAITRYRPISMATPIREMIRVRVWSSTRATRFQGVEFDGLIQPVRDLSISISGAYTDAYYPKLQVSPVLQTAGLIPTRSEERRVGKGCG